MIIQLGLYHTALGDEVAAAESYRKALFIDDDDVAATIHLCRLYLSHKTPEADKVDLAAGLLDQLTRGPGWDSPEAWYYLARACSLQQRKERERECLAFALALSERRGIRDVGAALGWCL
jgi:predicted Zn-dependent protease